MQYLTETGFAFVDPTCWLGQGVRIWHFAIVLAGCRLGDDVSIGSRCEIGFRSIIGKRTRISSGTFLPSDSQIGEAVFIGPNCTFTDDLHPRVPDAGDPPYQPLPPIIEDHACIGAHVAVCPGIRIGAYAMIGAGAIVTRDVPAFAFVRGDPARERSLSSESIVQWSQHPPQEP